MANSPVAHEKPLKECMQLFIAAAFEDLKSDYTIDDVTPTGVKYHTVENLRKKSADRYQGAHRNNMSSEFVQIIAYTFSQLLTSISDHLSMRDRTAEIQEIIDALNEEDLDCIATSVLASSIDCKFGTTLSYTNDEKVFISTVANKFLNDSMNVVNMGITVNAYILFLKRVALSVAKYNCITGSVANHKVLQFILTTMGFNAEQIEQTNNCLRAKVVKPKKAKAATVPTADTTSTAPTADAAAAPTAPTGDTPPTVPSSTIKELIVDGVVDGSDIDALLA